MTLFWTLATFIVGSRLLEFVFLMTTLDNFVSQRKIAISSLGSILCQFNLANEADCNWLAEILIPRQEIEGLFVLFFVLFFFFVYFHRIHSSAVRVQLRTIIWNVLFRCPQKVVVRQKSSCVTQSNLLCCLVLQFSALNNLREQSITQRMTFGGVSWCLLSTYVLFRMRILYSLRV